MNSCPSKTLGEGSKKGVGNSCKSVASGRCNKDSGPVQTDSSKVKVVLGEGSSPHSQASHVFYNRESTHSEVESLLVCPLRHSISIFKLRGQKGGARSYAEVVRGNQNITK